MELVGEHDYPIVLKETGTEDLKGIVIYDKNNVCRYKLGFISGHLQFHSYNSNGTETVSAQIA